MTTAEILAAAIPYGKENAISREMLSIELNMADRRLRQGISAANKQGVYILNLGDVGGAKGYYRPESMDEKYTYYKKERARAISGLSKLKPLRKELKEAGYKV